VCFKEVLQRDKDNFTLAYCEYLTNWLKFSKKYESTHKKQINLTPKHVWVMHYGRLAQEMGSMAHVDTQMGEQKNALTKSYIQRARQRKNILYTISRREMETCAVQQEAKKR